MTAGSYLRWLSKHRAPAAIRQIGGASAGVFVIAFLFSQSDLAQQIVPGRMVWIGSAATLIAAVAASSAAAVVLTTREISTGRRKLLRLTNVGRKALIGGYVFNALYHIRFLLLIAVGLSPMVITGWAYKLAEGEWFPRCMVSGVNCQVALTRLGPGQAVDLLLISVVVVVAMLSAILTNTAIGIWMALRWHDQELAIGSAFLLSVFSIAPTAFFFLLYIAASLYIVLGHDRWVAIPVLLVATLLGIAPYPLIGLTSLAAAEKWAWHRLEDDGTIL